MKISVRGLQKAQAMNQRAIKATSPSGALGKALQYVTVAAHRYLVSITHVMTGTLRAARRMSINYGSARGTIFTSPSARNPKSRALAAEYDIYEEARGGDHAAWARTEKEVGERVLSHGIKIIQDAIR